MYQQISETEAIIMAKDINDKSTLIGRVITLMLDSSIYLNDTLAEVRQMLTAPIFTDQAMIMVNDGKVTGYCSWAFLSDEAEKKYIADSNSLEITDWKSGDNIWLIDVITPFDNGTALLNEARKVAKRRGLNGRTIKFKRYKDWKNFQVREVRV
jgi:cytolysin-activating lysine-acyltransferase